jgi:hypothetical protein
MPDAGVAMRVLLSACALLLAAAVAASGGSREAATSLRYADPQPVVIEGYDGDAMEPFLARDGRYLFFNDLNAPWVDTDLHLARRIDATHFRYLGRLAGANSDKLDGVATMDRAGHVYFVSLRDYDRTRVSLFGGTFADGKVSAVHPLAGLSRLRARYVNFDLDVAPDGEHLYYVDGRFGLLMPEAADIVLAVRKGDGFVPEADSAAQLHDVNTDALEYAPSISADGLTLLFTRAAPKLGARPALYIAQRTKPGDPFGPAARLAALDGHVEATTFDVDERAIYYHRKVDGRFVIYRATRH